MQRAPSHRHAVLKQQLSLQALLLQMVKLSRKRGFEPTSFCLIPSAMLYPLCFLLWIPGPARGFVAGPRTGLQRPGAQEERSFGSPSQFLAKLTWQDFLLKLDNAERNMEVQNFEVWLTKSSGELNARLGQESIFVSTVTLLPKITTEHPSSWPGARFPPPCPSPPPP